MKRAVASFLCLALSITAIFAMPADVQAQCAEAVIYAVDSWAEPYLTLPPGLSAFHQISVPGASASSFRVISGESANVSATGVVTPRYETCYWYGSVGYNMPQPGRKCDKTTRRVRYGTTEIGFSCNGKFKSFTVEVRNYSEIYAEGVINAYIARNIPADMPFYKKLEKICQFPAQYNYSTDASHAASMIVTGGGDCWASTDAILRICKKLGIKAQERDGSRDAGAGGAHKNALITRAEGDYYELEAGFNQKAPRSWQIYHRTSMFSCRNYGVNGVEVYQYDPGMQGVSRLVVPDSIDGKSVLSIGKAFIAHCTDIKELVLPGNLTNIGDSAFRHCTSLAKLHLPATLQSVGKNAFANCVSLTNFTCDKDNPYLTIENGILYDRQKSKVIAAPTCTAVRLPDTVTTVGAYAFHYNNALTSVSLGAGAETLEEGAFSHCEKLVSANLGAVKTIGKSVFEGCKALTHIFIPGSVEKIESLAFCLSGLRTIRIDIGIREIGKNVFYDCPLTDIYYCGSEEQWNSVRKNDSAIPKNAVVHFNCGLKSGEVQGDVNGDGKTDNIDAALILRYDAGIAAEAAHINARGDVNRDGEADNLDAALILRYDAGMINSF